MYLKTSRALVLIVALLTLAAGIADAQAGLNDLQIAHAAYTADVTDIEYAKIALAKTKNPEVRQLAELMIRDHTAVNEGAAALLTKLKVQPEDNAFSQALNSGAKAKRAGVRARLRRQRICLSSDSEQDPRRDLDSDCSEWGTQGFSGSGARNFPCGRRARRPYGLCIEVGLGSALDR